MLEEAASTVADALLLRDGEVQIQHVCELYRIRADLHLPEASTTKQRPISQRRSRSPPARTRFF
jgi:hypothetical protein